MNKINVDVKKKTAQSNNLYIEKLDEQNSIRFFIVNWFERICSNDIVER